MTSEALPARQGSARMRLSGPAARRLIRTLLPALSLLIILVAIWRLMIAMSRAVESWRASGRDAALMRRLADQRRLSTAEVARASEGARELLQDWCEAGWAHAQMEAARG